jgi:hypothetical protein
LLVKINPTRIVSLDVRITTVWDSRLVSDDFSCARLVYFINFFGINMYRLSTGIAFFLIFCSIFLSNQSVAANNIESLSWLPFLTANMQRLQPDKNCPQNQVNDLQVNKNGQQINSYIRQVNWDLDCIQSTIKKDQAAIVVDQQKQIVQLLNQLVVLPKFELNLNTINLTSKLIKTTFSSKLSIKKSSSTIFVTFKSNLLKGKISLNLQSKKLLVNANFLLDKLSDYIHLTDLQSYYFHNNLSLSYQSDLNYWQMGRFKADWQGDIPEVAENVKLSIQGEVDLLKKHLTLSTFLVNAQKILMPISEKQSWKTGYIKLKNNGPVLLNYADMKIESLPLHIRLGTSSILTKVERGKSKRTRIDKQKLPPLFMQLAITGMKNNLLVDWGGVLLNQKLSGKLFLDAEFVKLQVLDNSVNLKSLVDSARSYVDGLDLLEIEKGVIKLNILAQYQRHKKIMMFNSQLITDDISGKNDNIIFDGASFNSRLHYQVNDQNEISILEDKQQLKVANLFVGVPIQSLQIDARIEGGEPVVQHFKARLLGGRLDFDDFKLNAPSQTILNVGGISLAEIIKYSAYPEIKSEAVIDGMLPLTLTANGPQIINGIIFARPPGGYIKVPENTVIKAMGRGNPTFSFTMQLLSNFQFDTMLGRIGYTSDGESDLKIEIKGISPTVSGTQPVNFNYSHNENILKLLKTLRFNDELVRDIKERY